MLKTTTAESVPVFPAAGRWQANCSAFSSGGSYDVSTPGMPLPADSRRARGEKVLQRKMRRARESGLASDALRLRASRLRGGLSWPAKSLPRPPAATSSPRDHNKEAKMKKVLERPTVLSATTLKGDRVRSTAGQDLGKIEEFMIDLENGRVAYAVLSFGGLLGVGNKLFAIPWRALSLDTDRHEFALNVDKETLEKAPGFDKNDWPDMTDRAWGSRIHEYYGYLPYWE
jgi:sporulation protein YlmC with PRC-barrel domain